MVFIKKCMSFVLILASVWRMHELTDADIEFPNADIGRRPRKPSQVKQMYNNSFLSDIKITFGNNKSGKVFYAHKYVLAISSPVFNEMFYTKTKEAIETIHLPEHGEVIAGFFGFIYKEECPTDYEKDLDVLCLIKQYQIVSFDAVCSQSFERHIEVQKSCKYLDHFLELKAEALAEICLGKIDVYADEYFTSECFLKIKQNTLSILLDRDTLYYNEIDIFKAVVKWVDHQCINQNMVITRKNRRIILGNAIYSIRFLLMNHTEFMTNVLPTDILYDNETVAILKAMTGEHVIGLVWDSVKLKSKRFPTNEWLKIASGSAKDNSITHYFWIFFSNYFIHVFYYLMFFMGIAFCFILGREQWTHRYGSEHGSKYGSEYGSKYGSECGSKYGSGYMIKKEKPYRY